MTFTTPCGTFVYHKISFGLINDGATFQRFMNKSFTNMKDKIIVIYLDEITIFSKNRKHQIDDLRKVLQRCQEH